MSRHPPTSSNANRSAWALRARRPVAFPSLRFPAVPSRSPAVNGGRLRADFVSFRALLDAIQVGACIVGVSGEILYANQSAVSLIRHQGSFGRATMRTPGDRRWDL